MELASNVAWAVTTLIVVVITLWAVRRGEVRVPAHSAFLLGLVVCFLLLPVISVSDDLLESRQDALPLSAQTWHLAWEGASVAVELLSIVSLFLLLFEDALGYSRRTTEGDWDIHPFSAWLTRSQRLRPPLRLALQAH